MIDVALESRTRRDDLLRNFRNAPYVFDIVMDIGAYRDLHRHRRCQQFRQQYSTKLGFETPDAIERSGSSELYSSLITHTFATSLRQLPDAWIALLASLGHAIQIPVQNGFRRSGIYFAGSAPVSKATSATARSPGR